MSGFVSIVIALAAMGCGAVLAGLGWFVVVGYEGAEVDSAAYQGARAGLVLSTLFVAVNYAVLHWW